MRGHLSRLTLLALPRLLHGLLERLLKLSRDRGLPRLLASLLRLEVRAHLLPPLHFRHDQIWRRTCGIMARLEQLLIRQPLEVVTLLNDVHSLP